MLEYKSFVSNKLYDIMKYVVLFFLPAFATLYLSLSNVWPLPYTVQILATISAIQAFIGAVIGVGAAQYYAVATKQNVNNAFVVFKLITYSQLYDYAKWTVQYFLPAISVLYFAIASIWRLPYPEEIVGTIAAITAFISTILGISSIKYNSQK
jgi:hypothetical protein